MSSSFALRPKTICSNKRVNTRCLMDCKYKFPFSDSIRHQVVVHMWLVRLKDIAIHEKNMRSSFVTSIHEFCDINEIVTLEGWIYPFEIGDMNKPLFFKSNCFWFHDNFNR